MLTRAADNPWAFLREPVTESDDTQNELQTSDIFDMKNTNSEMNLPLAFNFALLRIFLRH